MPAATCVLSGPGIWAAQGGGGMATAKSLQEILGTWLENDQWTNDPGGRPPQSICHLSSVIGHLSFWGIGDFAETLGADVIPFCSALFSLFSSVPLLLRHLRSGQARPNPGQDRTAKARSEQSRRILRSKPGFPVG